MPNEHAKQGQTGRDAQDELESHNSVQAYVVLRRYEALFYVLQIVGVKRLWRGKLFFNIIFVFRVF